MAISKSAYTRFQIIDEELCKNDYVKTSEIRKALRSFDLYVSEKTITNDIKAMCTDEKLGYFAPIGYSDSRKAHYYKDSNYTIKAFGLKEHDISALQFYAKVISQYKGYEVFKDFANAIDKILDAVTIRKGITSAKQANTIVQTETPPLVTGSQWISKIVEAINLNSILNFKYQKFVDDIAKEVKLKPYLLKENRHFWYVLGKNEKGFFVTYALDRINDLTVAEEKFTPEAIDFEDYFKYSFGITVTESEPVNVVLSFTSWQGKYIKTLPIHSTQKILIDNNEELKISVNVKPAYEFYEKILGYGENVKVISPPEIVASFVQRLKDASKRYS